MELTEAVEAIVPALIKARELPVKSICMRPIQEWTNGAKKCGCGLCFEYESKLLNEELRDREERTQSKVEARRSNHEVSSKQFAMILKKLLVPKNKIVQRGIDMRISEICFYQDGEPSILFMNGEQGEIIRINKEKLNNTQIQKIFNERRRKYRERMVNPTNNRQPKKKPIFSRKEPVQETKDAIVVHYTDGYEQLMTENEFINLMLRRRQDPLFKKIDFIKNYIGVANEENNILFVKYRREDRVYPQLYKRAQVLMRGLAGNISKSEKEYISHQAERAFCSSLQSTKAEAFMKYSLYKIVTFIQKFHDTQINALSAKFLINQLSEVILLHVYTLKSVSLVAYAWTEQVYQAKMKLQQTILLSRKEDSILSPRSARKSSLIQAQMRNTFEELKISYGLGEVNEDNTEEVANNACFKVLYPDLNKNMTEILRNPQVTVQKFQKEYLKYKKNKKPVTRDFNSTMIKTIHKLVPRFMTSRTRSNTRSNTMSITQRSIFALP